LILNPQISTVLKNAKKSSLSFLLRRKLGENPSFRNCFIAGSGRKEQQVSISPGSWNLWILVDTNLRSLITLKLSSSKPLMRPHSCPNVVNKDLALKSFGGMLQVV
jgi:hypothetical protein